MTTATYARYSSDRQRESSIDDQQRKCADWAMRNSLNIDRHYTDSAISGYTANRPGYQAMLADAAAGQVNTLIVDDLSRLGRDQVEREQTIRRLEFWGVRVVGVSDGYDSHMSTITKKTLRGVRGLFDELYLDDLAVKTHRGLEGQAISGNSAGGRSYGYRSVPIEDAARKDQFGRPAVIGAKKEIDQTEAETVQFIFQQYATGHTPRAIANELNQRGIPSPRGSTWAASAIYGDMKRGLGILNNPLYIGQYIWNRSKWVKDPDTKKRKRIERPQSDWTITDAPHLRIVDQETWGQVKQRQRQQAQKTARIKTTRHARARTGAGPKYLFSGLLKCGCCGGNYIMTDYYRYGCARHKDRGETVCNNKLKVKRATVEKILLRQIKQDLTSPESIAEFKRQTRKLIAEEQRQAEPERITKQLNKIQTEIDNILAAIRAGIITDSTKSALENAEQQKIELEQKLAAAKIQPAKITDLLPNAETLLRTLVSQLENTGDIPALRENIKQIIGEEITLHPTPDGTLTAELQVGIKSELNVVAGAGFEPTTFGL